VTDPKENMGCAAYIVRLVAVWGRLVRYMNLGGREEDEHTMWSRDSGFAQLKASVQSYKANLPSSLHWSQENLANHASEKIANQFIFLHIVYNQVILFMNRFALPMPGSRPPFSRDMPQEFIGECARAALDAAGQISILINEAMDHRVVAPFAGYSAFFSSTVHIHGLSSKNPAIEASSKQYLAWNVKYLSKMKKYWGMFHFMTEHLKDLYRRHADAGLRAQQSNNPPRPQDAIFQYGDWFDRYPHGVSGTDYEEAVPELKREPGSDGVLGQKSDLQSVEEFFAKMSPPSRAAASRKAARKKRTKSNDQAKEPTAVSKQEQRQQQQQQRQQQQQQQANLNQQQTQAHIQIPHMDAQMMHTNPQVTFDPTSMSATSGGQHFPQDLGHDMALLQAQQQRQQQHPGVLSHLDRQMVLSSYAGMDHNPDVSDSQDGTNAMDFSDMMDMNNPMFYGATANQSHLGGQANNPHGWHDQSSAWYLPFNVEPPSTTADDSGLFGGTYDFANFNAAGMAGFGDLGPGMDDLSGHGQAQDQGHGPPDQ